MASQAVRRVFELRPRGDDRSRVVASLELQCGCPLTVEVAEDRVVERPDGERFVVGKFPCPAGHPVRAPSNG
ncbi:hypothetical protein [Paraliomyxa miuraensis]|uniref:hypothetical protein n=1 Tax=Paraliomyxa miuraensis TaxID=376150 RepID=UPI002254FA02|nr:hypothetical protein [Paraliomyxa miuraensis]MCX4243128.1 hypothetical protein [Paraliomyxa miuraensis]